MSGAQKFDLIVIGSGPAGEKGAAQAAYFGKRVALVEKHALLGGALINTGTIPSKTLRETALYFSGLDQRGLYGIDYTLRENLTVPQFMHREVEVTKSLRDLVSQNLSRHAIAVYRGEARFKDPHTVAVLHDQTTETLEAPVILIATGSRPVWPKGTPRDPRLYDSDSILHMDRIPKSLAVIGAGVIGSEYATMFQALGVKVTLVSASERLLPFLDGEVGEHLRLQMGFLGLDLRRSTTLLETVLDASPDSVLLRLSDGDLWADRVLFAAGRNGATSKLGLDLAGLSANERGLLSVNENYQTKVPHIYAAGDVIGFPALASTSMEQARVAMCHAFDLGYKDRVSPLLPMAIYTIPEVAAVGETEESCAAKGIAALAGRASYRGNARGQIVGDLQGLIKLVFRTPDKKLLGAHIVGEGASELIHVGQAVMHFGGAIDDFIRMVFNIPTLGDAYKYAAYDGLQALAKSAPAGR
ncbi:MAG: Si-specific NAD(P)(+) transhydrogenase [Vicinamibacteria bacterium]|nr:Si-specific NAD(P)(+) transhydrogenase [Vicinamibacteria bacterium]